MPRETDGGSRAVGRTDKRKKKKKKHFRERIVSHFPSAHKHNVEHDEMIRDEKKRKGKKCLKKRWAGNMTATRRECELNIDKQVS